jgi:GrpB-like predicted nucleotidyltransferase (UPF0157 family)
MGGFFVSTAKDFASIRLVSDTPVSSAASLRGGSTQASGYMSTVVVSPYSAEWPNHFRVVREELLSVFAPIAVVVEHTGSTSVPGLAAKPVIDVLLGARSLEEIESKVKPLSGLGYSYVTKYEREFPMRRYFVKSSAASPRVHLHAVELGSRFWLEHLAFRDALRGDSALRFRYQSLKLHLAKEFGDDKSAYSAAKGPFIQSVLAATLDPNGFG